MHSFPRISFGIIVLNGEPFTRYCLRSIYPFAAEILVVEGAVPSASAIATADGHSTDGTLDMLKRFQREEDPARKLQIITAESEGHPDGFWPGEKDEMSRAYAKRASGRYLWQVDSDEFYHPDDIHRLIEKLEREPGIGAVSFPMITFWGGWDYTVDGWYLRRGANEYHRLFRWEADYRYVTHRPPTVHDAQGRDLRSAEWLRAETLASEGLFLYHYSLLFPKQVREKCAYYSRAGWARRERAEHWAQETFFGLRHPYRVHNVYEYPSWLQRFTGRHPPEMENMRRDIAEGRLPIELRETSDIERLLGKSWYAAGRAILRIGDHFDRRRPRSAADWRRLPARTASAVGRWLRALARRYKGSESTGGNR